MANENVNVNYTVQDNASQKMGAITKSSDSMTSSFIKNKLSVAALGAAMGLLIKDFAGLETKIVNVGNLFGATDDQMKELMDGVIDISKRVPQSTGKLADALFDVVSAGVEAGDSLQYLEEASKLAIAGVTDTKTAVDGLTSVMNAYNVQASDVNKISDKFFTAQQRGKTTIAELSHSVGQIAPIFRAAGLSIDEMFGSISARTLQGIKTDNAVVQMRQAVTSILKPTAEASKLSKELGLDFSLEALQAKGLSGFLKDVIEKTDGNTEAMAMLFGNVRALNGVLALSSDNFKSLEKIQKDVATQVGITDEAFKKQAATLSSRTQIIINKLLAASKEIIMALMPIIDEFFNFIELLMSSTSGLFIDFISNLNKIAKAVVYITKVIFESIKVLSDALKPFFDLYLDFFKFLPKINNSIVKNLLEPFSKLPIILLKSIDALKIFGINTKIQLLKITGFFKENKDEIEQLEKEKQIIIEDQAKKELEIKKRLTDAEKVFEKDKAREIIGLSKLVFDNKIKKLDEELDASGKAKKKEYDLFKDYDKKLLDEMRDFSGDIEDLAGKSVQIAFKGEKGILKAVEDSANKQFPGIGTFIGAGVGGMIFGLFSNIFGGDTRQTFTKTWEDHLETLKDRVETILSGIGEERSRFEKQIELLETLGKTMDAQAMIPTQFLDELELKQATTFQDAMEIVLKRIQATFPKERTVLEEEIKKIEEDIKYWQQFLGVTFVGSTAERTLKALNIQLKDLQDQIKSSSVYSIDQTIELVKLQNRLEDLRNTGLDINSQDITKGLENSNIKLDATTLSELMKQPSLITELPELDTTNLLTSAEQNVPLSIPQGIEDFSTDNVNLEEKTNVKEIIILADDGTQLAQAIWIKQNELLRLGKITER